MANKRNLKKSVNYISEVTISMCLMDASQAPIEKREEYGKLFMKINELQTDTLRRICHPEPGNIKLSYKKLKEDFNKGIDEVFDKFNELSK